MILCHRLPPPLIQSLYLTEMRSQLWKIFLSMRFVLENISANDKTADEPTALMYYYDNENESWPAESRPIQLLFNCFLSFIEADVSSHRKQPDRNHYIRDALLLNY